MISHLVLFRAKGDLSDAEREAVIAAFEHALHEIPTVRSVRVGRRLMFGAGYEETASDRVEFLITIDFDDLVGLQTYLEHPVHVELGERFNRACAMAMVFDFAVSQGVSDVRRLLTS
jgi:hypothetical protein